MSLRRTPWERRLGATGRGEATADAVYASHIADGISSVIPPALSGEVREKLARAPSEAGYEKKMRWDLRAGRGVDPTNNVAKSRLKWGLRLARACLARGFAGDVGVEITLVIDVAADGEPQP